MPAAHVAMAEQRQAIVGGVSPHRKNSRVINKSYTKLISGRIMPKEPSKNPMLIQDAQQRMMHTIIPPVRMENGRSKIRKPVTMIMPKEIRVIQQ